MNLRDTLRDVGKVVGSSVILTTFVGGVFYASLRKNPEPITVNNDARAASVESIVQEKAIENEPNELMIENYDPFWRVCEERQWGENLDVLADKFTEDFGLDSQFVKDQIFQNGTVEDNVYCFLVDESELISPVFTPEIKYWTPQILQWEKQSGVNKNQIATIIQIESCGNPYAESGAGAQGIMQVMPFHFDEGENPLDLETNVRAGLEYFARSLELAQGNTEKAFAGYNGGHGVINLPREGWPAETQRYSSWASGILNDIEQGLTESPTLDNWLEAGGKSLCQNSAHRLNIGYEE